MFVRRLTVMELPSVFRRAAEGLTNPLKFVLNLQADTIIIISSSSIVKQSNG
jgi:hypothetical protein